MEFLDRITVGMIFSQAGTGHAIEEILLEQEDIMQALRYPARKL